MVSTRSTKEQARGLLARFLSTTEEDHSEDHSEFEAILSSVDVDVLLDGYLGDNAHEPWVESIRPEVEVDIFADHLVSHSSTSAEFTVNAVTAVLEKPPQWVQSSLSKPIQECSTRPTKSSNGVRRGRRGSRSGEKSSKRMVERNLPYRREDGKEESSLRRLRRLLDRSLKQGIFLSGSSLDAMHLSVTSTGWQGAPLNSASRRVIQQQMATSAIWNTVGGFLRIHYK